MHIRVISGFLSNEISQLRVTYWGYDMGAMLKTTIVSPTSVCVNDDSDSNQFTILFQKSGAFNTKGDLKIWVCPVLVRENSPSSQDALCTAEEAQSTVFDLVFGPEDATMHWYDSRIGNNESPHFIVTVPKCEDEKDWALCFRSNGFKTTADVGVAVLTIEAEDKKDALPLNVLTPPAELLKYQAPSIDKFTGPQTELALNEGYTVSWKTTLANSCFLDNQLVKSSGSKQFIASRPMTHELSITGFMGYILQQKIAVSISSPIIKSFKSDKSTFKVGTPIKLSWDVASASSVSIVPGLDKCNPVGSVEVIPDGTTTYTLIAHGYRSMEPTTIYKSITVREYNWEQVGVCGDVKPGAALPNNCHIWKLDKYFYLYSHKQILRSGDKLQWEVYSNMPEPISDEIHFSTCIHNKAFYIAQHLGDGKLSIYAFELENHRWRLKSEIKYRGTSGRICSVNNKLYYLGIETRTLKYVSSDNGSIIALWDNIGETVLDAVSLLDYTYLAVKDGRDILIYVASAESEHPFCQRIEIIPNCVEENQWSRLIVRDSSLYFATENMFAKITLWQTVSNTNPYTKSKNVPWLGGYDSSILFISPPEKGEVWIY